MDTSLLGPVSGALPSVMSALNAALGLLNQLIAMGLWPGLTVVFLILLFLVALIQKGGVLVKIALFLAAVVCLGKALNLF